MKKLLVFIALTVVGCTRDPYVNIVEETLPKSVAIYNFVTIEVEGSTKTTSGRLGGAGVFVSAQGHILTAAHLFPGKSESLSVVCYNGDTYPAEILAIGENDLALIKISPIGGSVPFARIANPSLLRVGQEVLAIGNPKGLEFSVAHGIISALHRDFNGTYNTTQSDVMINPGNSGGPLFNLDGELVGINSFVVPVIPFFPINSGLSFSIQAGQIVEFITSIRKKYEGLPVYKREYWYSGFLKGVGYEIE